jgi:hypothetical protein
MSLSEAIFHATKLLERDTGESLKGNAGILTRTEANAIARLIADATITLNQISQGVLRREGRTS